MGYACAVRPNDGTFGRHWGRMQHHAIISSIQVMAMLVPLAGASVQLYRATVQAAVDQHLGVEEIWPCMAVQPAGINDIDHLAHVAAQARKPECRLAPSQLERLLGIPVHLGEAAIARLLLDQVLFFELHPVGGGVQVRNRLVDSFLHLLAEIVEFLPGSGN